MTPKEARGCFPGLDDKVFLDAACVSLIPRQAHDAILGFLDMALRCDAADASKHHIAMDRLRNAAVVEAAKLLKTTPDHVALVESTTHALNIAANAIPLERGDNVLVADTEFLQVAIPWARKQASEGIEIKPVRSRDGGVLEIDAFESAMDSRTKAVCVSSVQWSSGYRVDVGALGRLVRSKGVWLVVDAVHEMGALTIDLSEPWADFVLAGGHKWLNAPFGCGVLYVSDRVLRELDPSSWGYLALDPPEGGWQEYFETPSISPYRSYEFARVAKRFEIAGTSNYPGAVGLAASLKLVNDVGIENAERRIRSLAELLVGELRKVGARVLSSADARARSGITVFAYHRDPKEDRALAEALLRERIYVAMRFTSNVGGIRVSTHYFNDEEDVLKLIAALKRIVQA